jgi:hypothetical protein
MLPPRPRRRLTQAGHLHRLARLSPICDGMTRSALDLTCAECGRRSRAGETWRILFADVGEAFIFCPECAEREFGEPD